MTIDENNLGNVVRSLNGNAINHIAEANKMKKIASALQKIRLGRDDSMPIDQGTGQLMTAARRQAIHDACIGQAYLALGLNEDGTEKQK